MRDAITILTPVGGGILAKTIGSKSAPAKHYKWHWRVEEIDGLDCIERVLFEIRHSPTVCIVREAVAADAPDAIQRSQRAGHLLPRPRQWLAVDVDGYPVDVDAYEDPLGAVMQVRDALPAPLGGCECIAMISGSTTRDRVSVHLWFWMPEPIDSVDAKRWARAAPHADPTLYDPVHILIACHPLPGPDGDPLDGRRMHRLPGPPPGPIVEDSMAEQARETLRRGIDRVASHTVRETKHEVLRDVAWSLGGYIRAGWLDGPETLRLLQSAEQSSAVPRDPLRSECDTTRFLAEAVDKADVAMPLLQRGDDAELAEVLLREHPSPMVHAEGQWWDYAGGVWREVDDVRMYRAVLDFAGRKIKGAKADRPLLLSDSRVKGVLAAARALAASPDHFPVSQGGIAFEDGVLRLDGNIIQHAPSNRVRWALPYRWADITERPEPEFVAWLRGAIPEDSVQTIAVWYGLSLMGLGTRCQRGILLYGEGGDGKSVLVEVLRRCAPPGSVSSIALHDIANSRFSGVGVLGKLINASPESPHTMIRSGDKVKSIIAGDEQEFQRKFEQVFCARPIAGHMFASNELPTTDDRSHGFYRRFAIVTFNGFDGVPDRTLADRLATDGAGIIAWALRAAIDWARTDGGELPQGESAIAMAREWRTDNDPVDQWVSERLPDGDDWVASTDLYLEFAEWAEVRGYHRLNTTTFGRRLKRKVGKSRHKRSDGTKYRTSSSR